MRLLTELVEHGYARRIVQCNGTCILFNLISRCLAEERHVHQYGDLVKAVLVLLALIKPKDKGDGNMFRNSSLLEDIPRYKCLFTPPMTELHLGYKFSCFSLVLTHRCASGTMTVSLGWWHFSHSKKHTNFSGSNFKKARHT